MLSLEDCIAFSELTADQLDAVARHAHIPMVVAAEWAENETQSLQGLRHIELIIRDEIAIAKAHGNMALARTYEKCLEEFCSRHPELCESRARA